MRAPLRLLPFALTLLLGHVAGAKPAPPLERRDMDVAKPPARQVLAVTGTVGLAGALETRLERVVEVRFAEDRSVVALPLAVALKGRGQAITVDQAEDGTRRTTSRETVFTGREGPAFSAVQAPLLQLHGGIRVAADKVTIGPPTADGGVRPPAAGRWGTAWGEDEDPVAHALFAPADLDLVPVLAVLAGHWPKDLERRVERRVARPEGLPAWTQRTSVHLMGAVKDRALFEFEVVTEGRFFDAGAPTTLEQHSVGSLLVGPDGALVHGHVERQVTARDDEQHAQTVTSKVDLVPYEGEAPAEGLAGRFAQALALRETDPPAFRKRLLDETASTARRLVLEIRPDVPLDDVQVRVWDDTVDLGALVREGQQLADSPLPLDVLEEHGPTFEALGVLAPSTIQELRVLVPGGAATLPWAIAFAVPAKKLLLVKQTSISDTPLLAHEYAHVISTAKDYVDVERIGLGSAGKPDLAFVDVDGAIAAWALEEAQAEVTEEIVRRQVGHPLAFGLALKAYAASVGDPDPEGGLFDHLLHLLYQASPRVVAAAHETGDNVEATIARAFATYSYQTHQILFPKDPSAPSALFPKARALRGKGPTGATRVGAFGLLQALFRHRDVEFRKAHALVRPLVDDVVLRYPEGHLWVTRWTDAAAAQGFADAWQLPSPPADERLEVRGDAVVFRKGTVPDADAVVTGLLENVR